MVRTLSKLLLALAITVATAWVERTTDERTMYGLEGPVEENWQPREVAGWPAPFLADDPGTSVIHQIGVEDDFRPGPFVASWSFWLLVLLAVARLWRWVRPSTSSG